MCQKLTFVTARARGCQEDLTLPSMLNVIRSGLDHLRTLVAAPSASVVAASFSGGMAAYYVAKVPGQVATLVLFNPLIDYKQRFVDEKRAWETAQISDKAGRQLLEQSYVGHSSTFRLGRPMLNEVFWLQPRAALGEITTPTLIVHGTEDTFISVESSRAADRQLTCKHQLIELEGAQHGSRSTTTRSTPTQRAGSGRPASSRRPHIGSRRAGRAQP